MNSKRITLGDDAIRRATAVVIALAAGAGQAWAQSNATTTIFGEVRAPYGATVVVENLTTGVQGILMPDAGGRYTATSMPPGRYAVKVIRGGAVEASREIEAVVGSGVEASFAPDADQATQTPRSSSAWATS